MCKRITFLMLLIALLAASANAQFITSVAMRNGSDQPKIAPDPLAENSVTFVDRTHVYADIPEFILGAQYVMLANDDKGISAYELDLTFAINATLYVFVDNRMGGAAGGKDVAPNIDGMPWLTDMGFADTGEDIGIDESFDGGINQYFSIFALPVKAGTITIYGNTEGHSGNMLGVAALGPVFIAYDPDPEDGAIHEDTWVTLSWKPGDSAVSHDVYLGENFDNVNDATKESETFRGNQTTTFYVAGFPGFAYPEGLVPGTTYYWRIDEVNEVNPNSPWKGPVWSLSIPPKTAFNPVPADNAEAVGPDSVTLRWTAGFGAKLHTVYIGNDYDEVSNAVGGMMQGVTTYNAGSLEAETVYYWRVDEFDAVETHKGNIWTFTTPGAIGAPQPADNATGVAMTTSLSWTAATNATSHQVYLGLDKDAVRNADAGSPEYQGSAALGSESINPGKLAWYTMYYWRVDAVTNAGPVKGPVWSFTTADFIAVDDFESYTDDDVAGQAIWQSWIDGFGIADNGAQVGYFLPPYAEQTSVHSGSQSMPLLYTNEAGVTNSEATLTLTTGDWTEEGVAELSLWFRGGLSNAAEPLYVAISNPEGIGIGTPAIVAYENTDAAMIDAWTQWVIPLQTLADQGINLTNVDKIAIGLGSTSGMAVVGGTGTLYVDDIALYRSEP